MALSKLTRTVVEEFDAFVLDELLPIQPEWLFPFSLEWQNFQEQVALMDLHEALRCLSARIWVKEQQEKQDDR